MKIKISNKFLNWLLAALAAGIIFMEYFQPPIKIFVEVCAALVIIGIIFTWRKKFSVTAKIIFPLIFFALGAIRFFAVDNLPPNDISKFEGQNIFISGTIRDDPSTKILPNNLNQLRLIVDVESVKSQGKIFQTSGAMILTAYKKLDENFPNARIGDKVFAEGNLKFITNYKNPGQIDSVTRLKSDGITARMSAGKNGVEIESVEGNFWTKFLRFVAQIRQHYRDAMSQVMSSEDAAGIFAMLFGGYAGINPELVEEFQITGIVHILSVSGSHMSLLAIVTAYLCKILKLPRIFTLALGIFVIGTYTFLSGFLPQVIRSAIMGILVFTATALEVEAIGARFLAFAALGMLIVKPLLIFDVSFQLSFSSTAGLLYLAPKINSWFEKFLFHNSKFLIFTAPAAVTLSAQIASLPIIIWYFNQVSLSSVLSNIFVMPFLELVIIGGLFGGIVALIIPFFGKIIFLLESIIFSMGAELNRIFASFTFSAIQVPTLGIFAGFIYYVALIFRRVEIFLLLIVVLIFNFQSRGEVEVNFIDVGQGDCAIVFTPNRKCLIFDTGGVREKVFDIGGRVVVPYLKHENIREVEMIFLTHVHEDHSGGAGAIIKKMPVREIVTAGESKSEYAAVFGISENFLENLHAGKQNEKFEVDGVEVEIIFAPNVGTGNEISNVYKISYGDITFLITGDLIIENEEEILRERINVASTVLKVGHHGSKTSSSEEFLRAVNPKCAVISVGYGNNFGHPRAEVLERLESLGVKIFRTDINGLIKFKTDGKKLSVETFQN
ncbi:MAG: DNA internalization-related competence protein ComEC/Rec2 [Selenomonadaceae bacterium]|nr:DNA internalization-related competence protein ComEC/Rec2 [Selenomonadaceae bacterium]